jgi:hypothetical protein
MKYKNCDRNKPQFSFTKCSLVDISGGSAFPSEAGNQTMLSERWVWDWSKSKREAQGWDMSKR